MSVRPRQFDLIAFDWDGTLFDSTAIIVRSIQRAVQDVGGAAQRQAMRPL
jgi:phosphoglycolate phosphatase